MSLILGIESSCDETAAALVTSDRTVLAHRLAGQEAQHAPFGGVVPEIAARAHVEALIPLVEAALADAGISLGQVDAIAATAGPGLIGGVMVGLVTAKALALAAGKPLIAVNHLEGHALSPRLADSDLAFPYLLLLVSGGHCQLLFVRGVGDYARLATTIDDAAGEAFDKTAKMLGLGFPGGPAVERAAAAGTRRRCRCPAPCSDRRAAFLLRRAQERGAARARRATLPARGYRRRLPAGGGRLPGRSHPPGAGRGGGCDRAGGGRGVAANGAVRLALQALAARHDLPFVAPPLWLCTDNAAMIGWAGAERFAAGLTDPLDVPARARWPLDPRAERARGAGVKA